MLRVPLLFRVLPKMTPPFLVFQDNNSKNIAFGMLSALVETKPVKTHRLGKNGKEEQAYGMCGFQPFLLLRNLIEIESFA